MKKTNPGEEETPKQQSRYQRVKQILDNAQGDACPSYQGYERFWNLPLDQLLQVVIYGVRMIAPPATGPGDPAGSSFPSVAAKPGGGCCGSTDATDAAPSAAQPEPPPAGGRCHSGTGSAGAGRSPGRGAASGLIKGLRGQFPFDGSDFPRLPWGGSQVSDSDVQFIQDWIDDGCPSSDEHRTAIEVRHTRALARAQGDEEHPLSPRSSNAYRDDAGKIKARKNVAFLSGDELSRLRNAISAMHKYDAFYQDERSYNYWARTHANLCQHGWEEFLTWHRIYLYYFEQQLQDIDPEVTLPYWDWTMTDQDWTSVTPDSGDIPEAYRCFINQQALEDLKGKVSPETLAKLKSIEGKTYNSGTRLLSAAKIPYQSPDTGAIMTELQQVNALWHRKRWPGGNNSIIFEAYPRPEDIQNILKIANFFTFGSGPTNDHFFGALENIHNLIHNFSGGVNPNPPTAEDPQYGDMVNAGTTAFDPIFWGHHSNVDRLWAEWQTMHPGAGPDDPSAILPPWSLDVADSYNITKLGYEYVKSDHMYETDNTVPVTRFKSAKAVVHPKVLAKHKRAEIRLHKVQYSVSGGGFIRAFLNLPNADVNTPTRNNDNYVGQINLFSGVCIGGPGHCDPPPEDRRKFDLRPRHHKTPANFRLDATDTISKLVAKGAKDLHVNLVVMDVDGKPKNNALWLDAVSLNFFD